MNRCKITARRRYTLLTAKTELKKIESMEEPKDEKLKKEIGLLKQYYKLVIKLSEGDESGRALYLKRSIQARPWNKDKYLKRAKWHKEKYVERGISK